MNVVVCSGRGLASVLAVVHTHTHHTGAGAHAHTLFNMSVKDLIQVNGITSSERSSNEIL